MNSNEIFNFLILCCSQFNYMGRYDSLITVNSIFPVPEHLYDPCSTTIYNQFSSIFFFVNTAFLWNTVPYDIETLSTPKIRRALYPIFCYV